jgi:Mg-chelatase subunit ChlD
MNQDPPTPFDTVGDEHVEARIVAWVLGEASAFEIAELERLCSERPELLIFMRRMQAVHGLLGESTPTAADSGWKLAPARRLAIEKKFGIERANVADISQERRIRQNGRRALIGIAACLMLTVVVGGLMATGGAKKNRHEKVVQFMPSGGGAGQAAESREQGRQKFDALAPPKIRLFAGKDQEGSSESRRQNPAEDRKLLAEGQQPGAETAVPPPSAPAPASPAAPLRGESSANSELALRDSYAHAMKPAASGQPGLKENLQRSRLAASQPVNPPADAATPTDMPQLEDASQLAEVPSAGGASGAGGDSWADLADPFAAPAEAEPESRALATRVSGRENAPSSRAAKQGATLAGAIEGFATSMPEPAAEPSHAPVTRGVVEDGVDVGLTNGGDRAINRYSIDAILNNPGRVTAAGVDAAPPTLTAKKAMAPTLPTLADSDAIRADQDFQMGRKAIPSQAPIAKTKHEAAEFKEALVQNELLDSVTAAMSYEATKEVDSVRRDLYTAEGHFNLGKYDEAKREYEKVLETDQFNSAARRGLEKIASAKSDYYRAAYDHTRAELLSQVDKAWELAIRSNPSTAAAPLGRAAEAVDKSPQQSEAKLDSRVEPQKPAVNPVDLMEEITAAENPYSTFSLNVSDASFQIAKAALAKGEQPDPEGIKVEQFYNAVDYGDPAPGAHEAVAATIEQAAHPILPGRHLVRVALRTASAGRSAAQPLRLTLLVDQSGSMVREDRRRAMELAVNQLARLLNANDLVSVIGFSRTSKLLADGLAGDQGAKLEEIIYQSASEGGTNLEEAIQLGSRMAERHYLATAQNRIVLFTDGAANLGNADPAQLATQVKGLRQKGIAFDIAGIGADGLNDRLLGELARHGNGRYYVVSDAQDQSFARQLAGAFRPAAENVKVQVNFNPQRVARYKLIGFEMDRLQTEDFRNDAVDAAELAADEAGVAIYQVEPLVGGSGEIGEVSVRFKDTARGEMVERGWTIPYETATAFDRATPSMQLAGLSMLAAEKLKGGPLADAIDWTELTAPQAQVKQFYGENEPVADMMRLIDVLR